MMKKFKDESLENNVDYCTRWLRKQLGEYFTSDIEDQFQIQAKEWQERPKGLSLFDLAQIFLQQQNHKKELHEVIKDSRKTKATVVGSLEKFFEDKVAIQESKFENFTSTYTSSGGHVAEKKDDHVRFMLKKTKKANPRFDFVSEFIYAPLYKRFLYDRAPLVELVECSDASDLCLRSKFLQDFETYEELRNKFLKAKGQEQAMHLETAKRIDGIEKVIAAAMFCGEGDCNDTNVGFIKTEEGKLIAAKIDHGRSGLVYYTSVTNCMTLCPFFDIGAYGIWMLTSVDAGKLKEALDQVLSVSDEEIDSIVSARINELEHSGIDISSIVYPCIVDEKHIQKHHCLDQDDLRNYCINFLKHQRSIMTEFSEKLYIVSVMSSKNDEDVAESLRWRTYSWRGAIGSGKDLIDWARENGRTLRGTDGRQMDPDDWLKARKLEIAQETMAKSVIREVPTTDSKQEEARVSYISELLTELQGFYNKARKKKVLLQADISSLRKWCGKISPLIKKGETDTDGTLRRKVYLLIRGLRELDEAQKRISKYEITLRILSIVKAIIKDCLFVKIFGANFFEQTNAYARKKVLTLQLTNKLKEMQEPEMQDPLKTSII